MACRPASVRWGDGMELQQVVLCCADHAGRARIGIHLNGVPVVDDAQRKRLVIERNRGRIAFHRIGEINRRLFEAELADLEVWLQIAPALGAGFAGIAPVRRRLGTGRMRGLGCTGDSRAQAADATKRCGAKKIPSI